MSDIILHHYPRSPFAEKVRLALGLKRLAYGSVIIPAWMPKPELMPLTGGYRRTPVLQVGADIYCDTALILPVLERLAPSPSLYPTGAPAAVAETFGRCFEKAAFNAAVGIIVGLTGHTYARELKEDRLGFFGFSLEQADMLDKQALFADRLNAWLPVLHALLADGRAFLLGEAASAADLCAYHALWHLRRAGGQAEAAGTVLDLLPPLRGLLPWMDRVAAIGHGAPREIPGSEALAVARAGTPAAPPSAPGAPLLGLSVGMTVTVTPDDSGRDPVRGRLVAVTEDSVVVHRADDAVGDVHVHFPRMGFDVERAR